MTVRIVTDSTAGLTRSFAEENNVSVLPLYLRFEDEVFVENEIDLDEFHEKMASSPTIPSTSRTDYMTVFQTYDKLLAAGHDIIGIFISSDLTGPYSLSCVVWEELKEKYPGRRVHLIDSRKACMALGYTVQRAALSAAAGEAFEDIITSTGQRLKNAHIMFAPATLENLKKGGRIGGAAALLGSLLEIRPILAIEGGKVEVLKKCRGSRGAEDAMLQILLQDVEEYGLEQVIVHHCHDLKRGLRVKKAVEERLGQTFDLEEITPVIAAHVGTGAAGFAYFTQNKT